MQPLDLGVETDYVRRLFADCVKVKNSGFSVNGTFSEYVVRTIPLYLIVSFPKRLDFIGLLGQPYVAPAKYGRGGLLIDFPQTSLPSLKDTQVLTPLQSSVLYVTIQMPGSLRYLIYTQFHMTM